jgi:hypothetical protein
MQSRMSGALSNYGIADFLQTSPFGPITDLPRLEMSLEDITRRSAEALKSPALTTERGRTKPGRGRALSPDATSPLVYCAEMIAVAWKCVRGSYPVARNPDAAAAAEALWQLSKIPFGVDAAEDERVRWGTDFLNGWRPHFEVALAQTLILGNMHDEFVRHMKRASAMENESEAPGN